MFLEPDLGFPVAVVGKAPVVGKVTVRVQRVVLR
jgi:hypothetical protein